jgi:HEAT repeat protein
MDVRELLDALASDDEVAVQRAAHALGDGAYKEALDPLVALMCATPSASVRNACAIGLRELADARAVPAIVALIRDPRNAHTRGTLVHALGPMNPIDELPLLCELVATGGFEVRGEALGVIDALEGAVPQDTREAASAIIRAALPTASEAARPLLEELLAAFG